MPRKLRVCFVGGCHSGVGGLAGCLAGGSAASREAGKRNFLKPSDHQKVGRLTVVAQLDGPTDVAHVFLVGVDAELLVEGGGQIGYLDGIVFDEPASLVGG